MMVPSAFGALGVVVCSDSTCPSVNFEGEWIVMCCEQLARRCNKCYPALTGLPHLLQETFNSLEAYFGSPGGPAEY